MFNIYEKPEPSLCDTCKNSYNIEGGSVGIGYLSYLQRYCNIRRDGNIHTSGYNECQHYEVDGNK